ncbi:Met-10+ like-protein-domain-containing protein [Desarmillaria tabescens]|uniref:tRNA (guanine(37)-N1)-methyltransferase n=1 Tax=Armillaria tabescens TaxID=1929756 RepID=A0AA39NIM9_ARMTA|nr:Met-10+ like-protein-domain-containing protein [Desarmillaria tabescens]KAK0466351.1 Met-10+ like-protein-domain-containing protein [Desarmillaria tabescens]
MLAATSCFKRNSLFIQFSVFRSMHSIPPIDTTPPRYHGSLHPLDKDAFRKRISVLALRVPPNKTNSIIKSTALRRFLVGAPKLSPVVKDPSNPDGDRLVLLRITEKAQLSPEAQEIVDRDCIGFADYTVDLDYDYWTASEILAAVLPEELVEGSPVGFAATGHVAHFNLNDEYLPYKYAIGQVFLDKNKQIETVVNKLHEIDTQFRFFRMELLAGKPDYVVTHHESNCRFTFDFSQVYWNSRLHPEHDRIVKLLDPSDILADVFAGVGPFAIPAAKLGCGIFANDLNPNSAKYLTQNVVNNNVEDLVRVSCEDGRTFIRDVFMRPIENPFQPYTGPRKSKTLERKLQKQAAKNSSTPQNQSDRLVLPLRRTITHLVMNLPDSAISFLDAFRGVLSTPVLTEHYTRMPMVHCHCFTRELEEDNARVDILKRVEQVLGHSVSEDVCIVHIRSVAPGKEMYCISFRLPREVALGEVAES